MLSLTYTLTVSINPTGTDRQENDAVKFLYDGHHSILWMQRNEIAVAAKYIQLLQQIQGSIRSPHAKPTSVLLCCFMYTLSAKSKIEPISDSKSNFNFSKFLCYEILNCLLCP